MSGKSSRDSKIFDKDSDALLNIFLKESIADLRSSPWLKPSNILSLLSLITTIILGLTSFNLSETNGDLNKEVQELRAQVNQNEADIEVIRQASVSNPDPEHQATPKEREKQTAASTVVAEILISDSANLIPELKGVKIVYIQYQDDIEKAKRIQQYLSRQGIATPALERVDGISSSSIRYSDSDEKAQAIQLREFLEQQPELNLEFDGGIVDLSERGYNTPSHQFEIWLR